MSIGIYKITNPKGLIYIGQSINIERRFNEYKRLSCKNQTLLYRSLNKYGVENHIFEIIEECNDLNLLELETYWKHQYSVLYQPSLCCRIDGRGGYLSQETRDKISQKMKGKIKPQDVRDKISLNHSSSKNIYQYTIHGHLLKIWPSYSEAQRNNKGNIKKNILGKTKQAGGYIWLREEDNHLIDVRINKILNYQNPLKNQPKPYGFGELISKNIKGKKQSKKIIYLLENIEDIKKDYNLLSSISLAQKYNVSTPTMVNFLKQNKLYIFRNNYMG